MVFMLLLDSLDIFLDIHTIFFSYMYSFFEKEDKVKLIEDKKYTDI